MEPSEQLSFRRSRKFSWSAIIWFLVIFGFCQFGLWSSLGTEQQSDGLWFGVGGSLIFGALLFATVKDAFRSGAYLTMDDLGIIVPSTGIEIFRWEDIDHVSRRDLTTKGIKTHEVADLHLRNPADYFNRLSGLKKYTLDRFSLFLTSLDGDPDSIYALIEERLQASRRAEQDEPQQPPPAALSSTSPGS